MSQPSRLFLDGFNLALDQGTGVATYARNLSIAMGRLGHRVGVLLPSSFAGTTVKAHAVLEVPDSMTTYARELYGLLRELDRRGCDLVIASLPVEEGLGLAIANRLRRAAGPRSSEQSSN